MRSFNDREGRAWQLTVDLPAAKRVRQATAFDVMTADFEKLSADPITLVDVIYCLCKQQADAAGITDEQFGRLLSSGDAINGATDALLEELSDFFPTGRREVAKEALARLREVESKAMPLLLAEMKKIDVDAELQKMMVAISGRPVLNSTD